MPRVISDRLRQAIFSSETAEVIAVLVEIGAGVLGTPIRVCSGGADLTHGGNRYIYVPFRLTLPGDSEEQQTVSIEIDNVDRSIVASLADVTEALPVTIKVVLAEQPDTVEAGPYDMTLRKVRANALIVEGTLAFEDLLNEPYPGDRFTPDTFPGLF